MDRAIGNVMARAGVEPGARRNHGDHQPRARRPRPRTPARPSARIARRPGPLPHGRRPRRNSRNVAQREARVRTIASTSPSIVCGSASTSTVNPASRAVAEVTGPIEATLIPASASLPVTASKFFTVDELVNVIQSGLCASASFARSRRVCRNHGAIGLDHIHHRAAFAQSSPEPDREPPPRAAAESACPCRSSLANASTRLSATYSSGIRSTLRCSASTAARVAGPIAQIFAFRATADRASERSSASRNTARR